MTLAASLLLFLAASAQDQSSERMKKEIEKLKTDQVVLLRQVEVFQAQIKELTELLDKSKKEKADREQANRSTLDELRGYQAKQIEMARARDEAARTLSRWVVAPSRPLRGKVSAVATEIGLVVITVGSDDGVREGDEFTITRGGDYVAKVVVDRSDRKWSAGRITGKKLDPGVGDDAASGVPTEPKKEGEDFSPSATPKTASELQALRRELDDVRSQVQSLTDRVLPSWKDVGVTVEEASEGLCSQLEIPRGLLVRRVREGSSAARILKANDVIPDRTEAQLVEVLRSGGTLPVRRQGKLQVFQVDPSR